MYNPIENSHKIFSIPFHRLHEKGMLHPKVRRSLLSEEMRLIKKRLFQKISVYDIIEAKAQEKTQNIVLVTSSKPAEGKSFTALNLALSIVMDEKYKVLLIDGDLARATLSKQLGLNPVAGLTNILRLTDPVIKDFVQREQEYSLSFIPAGAGVASATDLFGGIKIRHFMHNIAELYQDHIIIFDSPPLLASTEASQLAQYTGQILYVIDGSETPKGTIESGLDILGRYDNVNLILNKISTPHEAAQFGTYYDYYLNE